MNIINMICNSTIVIMLFFVTGCTTYSKVITESSSVSHEMAVKKINESIQVAEKNGCRAVSVGSGVGIGFSAVECGKEDTIEGQTIYTTQVLLECIKELNSR
ncbi:MAG: hypothetical protein AB2551_14670 [Candidatus Thiodiazotropha sp.]